MQDVRDDDKLTSHLTEHEKHVFPLKLNSTIFKTSALFPLLPSVFIRVENRDGSDSHGTE